MRTHKYFSHCNSERRKRSRGYKTTYNSV